MNEIVWLAIVTVGSALVCCIIMLSASIETKWREKKARSRRREKEEEEETEVASAYWRTAVTATSSNGNYTNSSHTIQLVFYLKLRIQFNFFFLFSSFLSVISFRLFYIFKEKVQFKVMSPAKTRISNIEPSTIANRMHSINWNGISFLKNLNISRILKLPFVEMSEHIVFRIDPGRYLNGWTGVLKLNGNTFRINLGLHTVEPIDENYLVHSVAVYTTLALHWTESLHSKTFASYLLFVIFFFLFYSAVFIRNLGRSFQLIFSCVFIQFIYWLYLQQKKKKFTIVVNSRNIENAKCNQIRSRNVKVYC